MLSPMPLSFISPFPTSLVSRSSTSFISRVKTTHHQALPKPPPTVNMVANTVQPGFELVRPPPSQVAPNGPLTPSQIETFFEQGYIVVSSLVPPELLRRLQNAVPNIEAGKLGYSNTLYDNLSFRIWRTDESFKELAVCSPVAAAALQLTPTSTTDSRGVIVLKDAYFRMQGDNKGCGFHVDDPFFWPCPVDAPGPGVNAWVALNDVNQDGGGLTIAPGSHVADFVDCREAIKSNTCLLAELDPAKNERLESIAVSPQMKAGDVILHTRWLFHRGNPFVAGSEGSCGNGIARYSVRYMPAEAVINEIAFVDGKVQHKPPVVLNNADPSDFPAVELSS